jgi:hypothetical protein
MARKKIVIALVVVKIKNANMLTYSNVGHRHLNVAARLIDVQRLRVVLLSGGYLCFPPHPPAFVLLYLCERWLFHFQEFPASRTIPISNKKADGRAIGDEKLKRKFRCRNSHYAELGIMAIFRSAG